MSQAKRFTVFMEFRLRQFHGSSELGIFTTYNGRFSFTTGEFTQVRDSSLKKIITFFFNSFELYYFRYGIRVDPIQWIIVLTGKNEGEGYPSIILVVCK